MKPEILIERAAFANPEMGVTATLDQLVLATLYHRVGESALRTLIHLMAQASESDKVIASHHSVADLSELENLELIRWGDRTSVTIT